jgi:hypothetical protein
MLARKIEIDKLRKQIKKSPSDNSLKERLEKLEDIIKVELDLTKKQKAFFKIKKYKREEEKDKEIFVLKKEEETFAQSKFQEKKIE